MSSHPIVQKGEHTCQTMIRLPLRWVIRSNRRQLRCNDKGVTAMYWRKIDKGDKRALALADRHYTRQTPGSNQFCRPGNNLVLLGQDGNALWVTWRGIRDDRFTNAWKCTMFRNESPYISSHLIMLAIGITVNEWGTPPSDGMITYVGKHLKGGCFHAAGFRKAGESKGGKPCLQLLADRFPPPLEYYEKQMTLFDAIQ